MSSIEPRTTAEGVLDDSSWLGSEHGTDSTESITLLLSAFTEETHYPDGFIPSGTVLGKITASGLYGPYSESGADNGLRTADGFLAAPVSVITGTTRASAALLTHGKIVEARLPESSGIDADAKTDLGDRIRFI